MSDYRKMLDRLEGAMLEDIMSMTDEEVLAEAREDGIDVEARAAEMRKWIAEAIGRTPAGASTGRAGT